MSTQLNTNRNCRICMCYTFSNHIMGEERVQKKPRKVGDYVLGRTIGLGTFASVRQAVHTPTGEKVSVKILSKSMIQQTRDRLNLSREIRILKKLRHPNIAQLLQILETNKRIYLVLEYAGNGELFTLITSNQQGRLREKEAARIFGQLINALEYLHVIGVAHRDIKPENILLDADHNVKIIDFGLSSFYQRNEKLKTSCGSPCYAAPEMLVEQAYDPLKADLWSCGVVFYAMVCGFLPYEEDSPRILYERAKRGNYDQPNHLSPQAIGLIAKMLKFVPSERAEIHEIRSSAFFRTPAPAISGLLPSEKIALDLQLVAQLNKLGYYGFRDELESHKHNSATAAYYLLLYKSLRLRKQSLQDYFQRMHQRECIMSPFRSKSLALFNNHRPIISTCRFGTKAPIIMAGNRQYSNGSEEHELLSRLMIKNKSKMRMRNRS